jgi:flagellar hook-associated protein 1
MMGLGSLFDIARSALHTSQQALAVTGHNVSNVNTPGYSRQETVLVERPPVYGQPGMVGTGVRATAIRRHVDTFINRQLTVSEQNLGRLTLARDELFRLQNLFNDSTNQGMAARLNDFFQGLQDVSTNPGEPATRSVLLMNAAHLAAGLNQTSEDLRLARQSLNAQVTQAVTDINGLARQIAALNDQIVTAEVSGQQANDLRDQRDLAINELAQRVDVTTFEDPSGAVAVFVARGQILVEKGQAFELAAIPSPTNQGLVGVGYVTGGVGLASLDPFISNGRLRALLDLRDTTVRGLQQSFDQLAGTLANAVNQIHRQGFGLDGSTSRDFFTPVAVTTTAGVRNLGTGTIGAGTITANSLLTFQDYEVRFSSPSDYSIVNASTGSTIRGNYTGTVVAAPTEDSPLSIVTGTNDTLVVSVDGVASGTITLAGAASPGAAYTSGSALAQEMQTKINADAALQAAGRTVTVTYDTTTSRFVLTSNSTASTSSVDVTGGAAQSSLGLLSGTSTAASGVYAGPMTLTFDGLSISLSGTPSTGDVFHVNSYEGMAQQIAVALSNPLSVAASSTRNGMPGNNANLLELVALQHRSFQGLGSGTIQDAYRRAAANLGSVAQTTDREQQTQDVLRDQIESFRAQVSGVSLDEELVALIKFQRSFEAASRLVRVTDELFQTLLSLKP